jgi:mRNA interferase RelE/StbE
MGYKIIFSDKAGETFDELDNSTKVQIKKFLDKETLKINPRSSGKALRYDLYGLWRYRVGNWRIIAEIKDTVLLVLVLDIDHRSNIYK